MKKTFLTILLLSFVSNAMLHADDDKENTYKLKVTHVEKGTKVVVACENGYNKKKNCFRKRR